MKQTSRPVKEAIKAQLRRSVWALSAAYVVDDAWWRMRLKAGWLDTGSGSTHRTLEPLESASYIRRVFEDYKRYGEVDAFQGRCAELGPGDSAGVALLLRADGASVVDLVDRYVSRRNIDQQQRIYEELARQCPNARLWGADGCDDHHFPGVNWRLGSAAEEHFAGTVRTDLRYDFIVSRSVLEHLYDPLGCLTSMVRALGPRGRMIHKVDLRDHGMFAGTNNPLQFLHIPGPVYRRMTRSSGRPNRVLFHQYRQALEALSRTSDLKFKLIVTQLAGVGEVLPHVPFEELNRESLAASLELVRRQQSRFASELRAVPAEDVAVQGMFIVAWR